MPQIHVHATDYDLVSLDDFTLDEAMVLWDYSKLSLAAVPDLDDFHPGVVAAIIHVSIARARRDLGQSAIRKLVGALPVAELENVFADISEEVEDDEALLPPPSAPGGPSDDGTSPTSSGGASPSTGEPLPASARANGSGEPGSVIGATSPPTRSDG